MRIAIAHNFTWTDVRRGGERYAHDLTWWLTQNGHEVDYVAGGPAHSITSADGARIVRLHHRHGSKLDRIGLTKPETFGVTVLPWLARNRYDVVVAFAPAAALAARMTGQRTVFTALGHPLPGFVSQRRMYIQATRRAHVATALTHSAAKGIEMVTGRLPIVVNPGLRSEAFTPSLAPRTGPPRILFAAHAGAPNKRLPDLLAAMPRILDALPDARLLIGGGGDLPDGVEPRVLAATDVIGTGSLDDVPQRFRDATVTVLPSEHEAFGLVLVESLACGTPVVGANAGGIREVVRPDAGIGALSTLADPVSLADAIIETVALAADQETPARCTVYAQQWSWEKVGPQHLAAFEQALSRPK